MALKPWMTTYVLLALTIVGTSGLDTFIRREGDRLFEGFREFHFISYNMPGLTVVEDPSWHLVDEWEQEDALKTIREIGGRVVRVYTFSIHKASDPPGLKRHVYGPRKYDEDLFRCFDKMLQLCHKYGIRVIVPFIDEADWWGGIREFKAFRHAHSFYEHPQVKQDFKDLITDVLNRVNVYTGVRYRDDPAIMAWETGNELLPFTSAWTKEIAAHIKSEDPNHLVMDGRYGIDTSSLSDPNVDIVSNHYYHSIILSFAERCRMDRKLSGGRKAFIVGEFGIAHTQVFRDLLEEVIADGTVGALIWSLRQHNKAGGFYKHREGTTNYYAYHWPGFRENQSYDEEAVVKLMKDMAYHIRREVPPPLSVPEAPALLATQTVHAINWRGSMGARSYNVGRAKSKDGDWVVIRENVTDSKQIEQEGPLYDDKTAPSGQEFFYRVLASNDAGVSSWSNVIGPVKS